MALRDLWAKLTGREKPAEAPAPELSPPPGEPPAGLTPPPAEPEPLPGPAPGAAEEPVPDQAPAGQPPAEEPAREEPAREEPSEAEEAEPQPPAQTHPAVMAPAPSETRSPDPEHAPLAPIPPHEPLGAVAPAETRSDPLHGVPGLSPDRVTEAEAAQPPPGDLPRPPAEVPPPARPGEGPLTESPVQHPPEVPPPSVLPEAPIPSAPPEQPAAPGEPSPVPPGWQPVPAQPPLPPAPPPAAPPPPETPAAPPLPEVEPEPAPEAEPPPGEPTRPAAPPAGVAPAATVAEEAMVVPPLVSPPGPDPDPAGEAAAGAGEEPSGWFGRLRAGLSRSTQRLTGGITGLFTKRKLDDEALEELEEALITADLGVSAASRIVENFRRTRFGREVTDQEVKEALSAEIATILEPVARPLVLDRALRPHVVLVVGVNGTGKTTTIAKLGQQYREEGRSVTFVAGDTFRAAAVEQLQIWGGRTGCDVVAPAKQGADAAGLAFDALKQAQEKGTEVLLVDTAGRLHNKSALMEELRKVVRVMQRIDPTAPHSVLLVLDATTGQNATQQAKVFSEMVNVTGLVVTKLDGSAKGGVVVALAQEFGLPVHAVGVGEKAADLRPFSARDYARGLLGLN